MKLAVVLTVTSNCNHWRGYVCYK